LTSQIRKFDNELQKCYNINVLSDVVYKRITEKANYPKKNRRQDQRLSEKKENVPRKVIYIGEPILSNRENGFYLFKGIILQKIV